MLISNNLNADPKYTVKNGKSVEILDPIEFDGEVIKIYRFTDYDVLHIKDKKGNIIKGRFNTHKNERESLDRAFKQLKSSQYSVGTIKAFKCKNYNYSEYEVCY